MLKVGLLCGVIAAMSATGLKASFDSKIFESKPCDATFIVELEDEIKTISTDKAIRQQKQVFSKIKNSINKNAIEKEHYTLLNNAFVVNANLEDLEAIKKLPGVKYVTVNGTHRIEKTESSSGGFTIDTRALKAGETEIDLSQNASAITMNKPEGTNDGEGTLIAVLDNEFYFRAEHVEIVEGAEQTIKSYNHETFSELDDGVIQKLKFATVRSFKGHAEPIKDMEAGKEGSLYYNNKVPFYYDYAGDSENGSSYNCPPDYNVESTLAFHGSHVASIAAGNAPESGTITSKDANGADIVEECTGYKGIAPKAQLACMKVFSDVRATPVGDKAKMGDYSTFNEVAFINALEDCIKLGVDAINVSIGSDLADFEQGTISQRTLQNISDAGILSAISAGNGGKSSYAFTGGYANWTRDMVETGVMGSFANNASTMSIAAGQPEWVFYENSLRIGDQVIPFDDQIVNREGTHDYNTERRLQQLVTGSTDPDAVPTEAQQNTPVNYIYVKGFGEPNDYKKLDVNGKVAVVNRGKSSFAEKYAAAYDNGAIALLIINNDPTENDFTFRCDFGGEDIRIPVAIVLFKDKPFFDANQEGTFLVKKNQSSVNKLARTISDFSTDGCTYDLDLKPEITSPGSNIKGAVWPQNKFEKQSPFTSYEYLNGTSMAAPNYEGAMAVLLSKLTGGDSPASKKEVDAFKKTIDMRMMSTAIPMHDAEVNGENGVLSVTSPRMQGAGLVNLDGAYKTDVYLEGTDGEETINKSKILLRNNDDIAKGIVKLEFVIHNDSNSEKTFTPSFSVMRPATVLSNKVLSSEFHSPVEYTDVRSIPGFQYFSPEKEQVIYAEGNASKMDVIKITKDIEYFTSAEEYQDGEGTPTGVLKEGLYYCDQENPDWHNGIEWKPVPDVLYQSVKDIEIAKVDNLAPITVGAKKSIRVALDPYELTKEQRDTIASLYSSGTYIEGYVSLKAASSEYPDLSIPYLGFYSLNDRNSANSFSTAPVVEPFEFEKDPKAIYGSDLINDVTKSLLGKDNVEFGSMMLAGYAKNVENIPLEKIVTNDSSFLDLSGFYPVGTTPTINGVKPELTESPSEDIYLGNPYTSNTLIVQQFVMRSVADNYFTITNKVTGKEVYRNALEDMLFGQTFGKYALYKSHIDADYLGGGYVAHRAYALIPLYDIATKKAFESGEYELKFNYQLAATNEWVSKAYTLHIDAESPVVSSIIDYKDGDKDMVRITYKDMRASYAIIASTKVDVKFDEERGVYYSELEKSVIDSAIAASKQTSYSKNRLYLEVFDYARGVTSAIVHFDGSDYSHFTIVQGYGLTPNDDFKFENGELKFIRMDDEFNETEFVPESKLVYINGVPSEASGGASLGLVLGLSIGGGVLVLGGGGVLLYFFLKKKRKLGGK